MGVQPDLPELPQSTRMTLEEENQRARPARPVSAGPRPMTVHSQSDDAFGPEEEPQSTRMSLEEKNRQARPKRPVSAGPRQMTVHSQSDDAFGPDEDIMAVLEAIQSLSDDNAALRCRMEDIANQMEDVRRCRTGLSGQLRA